ncbi:hypothetical protein MTR67_037110 [Solanum verrucosum]|uniref:ATP-dependent Clp protease proteolytic subunit n=2 Tax=Solanum TaxID=4107 RepID=A0AAF0UDB9_SOLVR|nr:hypothetical protein MTR67_037110 [Solanum verrucosum]
MAVALPTTSSSYLHSKTKIPKSSLSYASKVYVGLRIQSPGSYGVATSNLNVDFFSRVHKSIESGDMIRNEVIQGQVGVTFVAGKMREARLRWFGYVKKRCADAPVRRCERTKDGKATRAQVTMMPIGTPKVPYRNPTDSSWQWVDLWNALYRERVIFIGEEINEEFSNQILATMLYLDSIDSSKKLYMFINGPGGDLTPTMAIYDTMQSLKSAVGTHCVGFAYNLAAFLLAAGEKGNRCAMPLSRIALESPAGAARGQADDIRNEAEELLRIRNYLFKELSEKTGQPIEKVHKDLSRVKRFTAKEALEYGLIDRIVRPSRIDGDAPPRDITAGLG